jgi:hydrogenase expression/formation protein HypD
MNISRELREGRKIRMLAGEIKRLFTTPVNIMEICGGHTHVIMKYCLSQMLPEGLNFLHGPGCPVCIMPRERIDHAISLSRQKDVIIVTLGDMMRVPGSSSSLIKERAMGRDIRMVYSPLDTVKIARENPGSRIIYIAIGFETTSPLTAAVIQHVIESGIDNVLFHINHVLVPPALHAIMNSEDVNIHAFIAPGHVSTITGSFIYKEIVERYGLPVVISGFEPVDILQSVKLIITQLIECRSDVEIQYTRAVTPEGNRKAQMLIERYFNVRKSFRWRGIGEIPESGLELREEYSHLDAEIIYKDILPDEIKEDHGLCICGDILRGKASPVECKVFGSACTPKNPVGACMVSSEGACHAYYTYQQVV